MRNLWNFGPVASQKADIALIYEILCAKKALSANLKSSADHKLVCPVWNSFPFIIFYLIYNGVPCMVYFNVGPSFVFFLWMSVHHILYILCLGFLHCTFTYCCLKSEANVSVIIFVCVLAKLALLSLLKILLKGHH